MSYRVLALKWRPRGFKEVVAQEHVTQTLINSIDSGRLANAYLFAGPRGVGKTTTARILAKALNCQNSTGAEPCDACGTCREITQGRCLDVFEIDGASNRGIDEIRDLRESVRYAPSSAKMKIYIVDEVHMLTTEAFNALLKTLEEPPPHVKFIFATTEPHKVPATILSRCQRFDFKRIPLQRIVDQLRTICTEEKIKVDEEALLIIAGKADGSLRDGESLLDQMIAFCGTEIRVDDVLSAFSVVSQDTLFELTGIIAESDAGEGIQYVERLISSGHDLTEFLQALTEHLRNMLLTRVLGHARTLEITEHHKERYVEESRSFSQEDLLRMIQVVARARREIRYSPNPRIRLETCLLKLIKLDQSVTLQHVIERLESDEPKASEERPGASSPPTPDTPPRQSGPAAAPQKKNPLNAELESSPAAAAGSTALRDDGPPPLEPPAPDPPAPEPPVAITAPISDYDAPFEPSADSAPEPNGAGNATRNAAQPESQDAKGDLAPAGSEGDDALEPEAGAAADDQPETVTLSSFADAWHDLIQFVQTRRLFISIFLKEGHPNKFENNILEIGFPNENGFQVQAMERNRDIVLQAIQEVMNASVGISFVKTEVRRKTPPAGPASDAGIVPARKKIDPKVKRIMEIFDGELTIVGGEDV